MLSSLLHAPLINGMLLLVNIFYNSTPVSRHLIYAKRRRTKYKLGGWGVGLKKQTKNFCYLAETYLTHTASASFSIDPQKPFKNLYLWYINGSTSVYRGCRVFVKQTKSKTRKSVAQQSVQNTHMCLLNYECDFKHQTCWTNLLCSLCRTTINCINTAECKVHLCNYRFMFQSKIVLHHFQTAVEPAK